jgi:hypothetical protein
MLNISGGQPIPIAKLIEALQAMPARMHCTHLYVQMGDAISFGATGAQYSGPQKVTITLEPMPASTASAAGWRPIETAPRDGTEVLVARKYANGNVAYAVAAWFTDQWRDAGLTGWGGMEGQDNQPSYWMPLPPPPPATPETP